MNPHIVFDEAVEKAQDKLLQAETEAEDAAIRVHSMLVDAYRDVQEQFDEAVKLLNEATVKYDDGREAARVFYRTECKVARETYRAEIAEARIAFRAQLRYGG